MIRDRRCTIDNIDEPFCDKDVSHDHRLYRLSVEYHQTFVRFLHLTRKRHGEHGWWRWHGAAGWRWSSRRRWWAAQRGWRWRRRSAGHFTQLFQDGVGQRGHAHRGRRRRPGTAQAAWRGRNAWRLWSSQGAGFLLHASLDRILIIEVLRFEERRKRAFAKVCM